MNTKNGWSQRHENKLALHSLSLKTDQRQFSLNNISAKKENRLWELIEWSPKGKGFGVIKFSQPNPGNLFEKFEMPCYVFVKNFSTLDTG